MKIDSAKLIPKEITNFKAHAGTCYCGGIVKMARTHVTCKLEPSNCWCLKCGQRYFVKLKAEEVEDWAIKQWKQKTGRAIQ